MQMALTIVDDIVPELQYVTGMARAYLAGELHMESLSKQHASMSWHIGRMLQGTMYYYP